MAIVEQTTASGVSFELTDEQRDLRALAHEFAEKEIRPKAAEYDEHQTHPADVIAKAHEIGLMNPHLPEGLGDVSCFPALFAELLDRGWSEDDCARLAGGNVLRVLRDAEAFSAVS